LPGLDVQGGCSNYTIGIQRNAPPLFDECIPGGIAKTGSHQPKILSTSELHRKAFYPMHYPAQKPEPTPPKAGSMTTRCYDGA